MISEVFVTSFLVGNLHERDIRSAIATWDLFLLLTRRDPSLFSVIDLNKVLLPKILSLLKNGFFGTATSIAPLFVVFMDKYPDKSLETLSSIIGSLVSGFSSDTVRIVEAVAICGSVCDCFKYIAKKCDTDVAKELVEKHLTSLIQESLLGSSNVIKGADMLLRMLLSWLNDNGSERKEYANFVFGEVAEKVKFLSPEASGIVRVQQWIGALLEAGKNVQESVEDPRSVLTGFVQASSGLQVRFFTTASFLTFRENKTKKW